MSRQEFFMTLGCLGFGAFFLVGGTFYEVGQFQAPGGGFFPFWGGLILVILSGAHLLLKRKELGKTQQYFFSNRRNMQRLFLTFLSLVAYALLLNRVGFILTTFLFMVFLFRFIAPQKWKVALGYSLITAAVAYAFFVLWLGANLPAGVLRTVLPL